jgi:hypothetical protein
VPGTVSKIATPDFCLAGINMPVKKGYFMRIMRGGVVCWGGYCNLSKPNIYANAPSGEVCKKRWASQTPVVYDPFATENKKKKHKA